MALKVKRIEMGTVLDHLPPGTAPQIMRILDIDPTETTLLVAINVESSKMGRKDILKIEGKILSEEEANKVALVAPNATVNIVRDYSVAEKFQVKHPRGWKGSSAAPTPTASRTTKGNLWTLSSLGSPKSRWSTAVGTASVPSGRIRSVS